MYSVLTVRLVPSRVSRQASGLTLSAGTWLLDDIARIIEAMVLTVVR